MHKKCTWINDSTVNSSVNAFLEPAENASIDNDRPSWQQEEASVTNNEDSPTLEECCGSYNPVSSETQLTQLQNAWVADVDSETNPSKFTVPLLLVPCQELLQSIETADTTMQSQKNAAACEKSHKQEKKNSVGEHDKFKLPSNSPKWIAQAKPPIRNLLLNYDRIKHLKEAVDTSIRYHKVFSIQGTYNLIRRAMQHRGWIEKIHPQSSNRTKGKSTIKYSSNRLCQEDETRERKTNALENSANKSSWLDSLHDYGWPDFLSDEESDSCLMSRMLRCMDVAPDFIWTGRRESIQWKMLPKELIINRFPNAGFTTKVGLCTALQQMHWFHEENVSGTFFPRCYILNNEEEREAFKEDFRQTACFCILKWLLAKFEEPGGVPIEREPYLNLAFSEPEAVAESKRNVPYSAIEFALQRTMEYLSVHEHEDIDIQMPPNCNSCEDEEWTDFLNWYYMLVHDKRKLRYISTKVLKFLVQRAQEALEKAQKHVPYLMADGIENIWIIKPGAKSRGRGIQMTNKLDKALQFSDISPAHEHKYVVQKYIERPFLIFNTKFDIRQWFLVTDWYPLTVWMYRDSYLRFCSKTYSLADMHESIHLCNNAVQRNYSTKERENNILPEDNMWDCYTFQAYLKGAGINTAWSQIIYPGMRMSIVGALLASQDSINNRKNSFELYGADFMLTEDLQPWLIEINSCPCMAPSTSVTARLCAQCLEDIIKVVIDRRDNKSSDTGMYELVYKQHLPNNQLYTGIDLHVRGIGLGRKGPHDRCTAASLGEDDKRDNCRFSDSLREAERVYRNFSAPRTDLRITGTTTPRNKVFPNKSQFPRSRPPVNLIKNCDRIKRIYLGPTTKPMQKANAHALDQDQKTAADKLQPVIIRGITKTRVVKAPFPKPPTLTPRNLTTKMIPSTNRAIPARKPTVNQSENPSRLKYAMKTKLLEIPPTTGTKRKSPNSPPEKPADKKPAARAAPAIKVVTQPKQSSKEMPMKLTKPETNSIHPWNSSSRFVRKRPKSIKLFRPENNPTMLKSGLASGVWYQDQSLSLDTLPLLLDFKYSDSVRLPPDISTAQTLQPFISMGNLEEGVNRTFTM